LLASSDWIGRHTTFSSSEYETLPAARDGGRWMGLLYVTGSVTFGFVAVGLGAALIARR
jgi:fluoride ion exporter CrcB/FEX